MAQIAVGSGGSWATNVPVWVGSGGSWVRAKCWVGTGGSWVQVATTSIYSGTLTAAAGSGYIGLVPSLSLGSISPTTDSNGHTISQLYTFLNTGTGVYTTTLSIASSSSLGATYFTTLTINAHSLAASSASYAYSGGNSTWTWASTGALTATGSYPLTIT